MKSAMFRVLLTAAACCLLLPLHAQQAPSPSPKKPPQTWVIRVLYLSNDGDKSPYEHLLWLSRQPEDGQTDWQGPQTPVRIDLPLVGYKSLAAPDLRKQLSRLPEGSFVAMIWPTYRTARRPDLMGSENHNDFAAFCEREKLLFQVTWRDDMPPSL